MNEVVIRQENIPSKMEDLSRFVLVGREKLVAVRAEIRAIERVGLAQEVREQKLREAQDISETVLDAEVRIGELMARVPKATGGQPFHEKSTHDSGVASKPQTKQDIIRDAGFTPKQVQRFQTLAAHPEIVEQAKAEARENDDIISRAAVLNKIREGMKQPVVTEQNESVKEPLEIHTETTPEHKPHVSNNSGNNEW